MRLKKIKLDQLELPSNLLIAPLAGYTNLPTRLLFRAQGAGIVYAEMVSAEGLNYNLNKSIQLLDSSPDDRPLGIQLFGANAERIKLAFQKIKQIDFDLVDINCGCSVKKILKARSGAYLLKDPDQIYQIIKSLKNETDKPVTLKIRSGWDQNSINFLEVLEAAQSAKASLITFHARTKSMLFKGKADWEQIKMLKAKSRLPVIGNGDIFTARDAVNMFNQTNCDGIMVARGLLENPFLIEEIIAGLKNQPYTPPSVEKRLITALNHCHALVNYFGEKKGLLEFRKFMRGYIRGLKEVSKLRQKINCIESLSVFQTAVHDYYQTFYQKKLTLPA